MDTVIFAAAAALGAGALWTRDRSPKSRAANADAAVDRRRPVRQTPGSGRTEAQMLARAPRAPWWIKPTLGWARDGIPDAEMPVFSTGVAPPPLPRVDGETRLGSPLRTSHFQVDPSLAFLNHGSYGATLRACEEAHRFYVGLMESNPVAWMEDCVLPLMADTLRDLGDYVGADPEDLALVTNATMGCNSVIRSLPAQGVLRRGDAVLCLDISYGAVVSTLEYVCECAGATLLSLPVQLEPAYDPDQVVAALEDMLAAHPEIVFVNIDHVASRPGVVLPVERMAPLCKAAGARVLLDAAHAVGGKPLDLRGLEALGVDYYTSNCHKWLSTPKGTAFLWVAKARQHEVRPTTISHGYNLGFQREFMWSATQDYTRFLTLRYAMAFYRRLGVPRIHAYCKSLMQWAMAMLVERWGTAAQHSADDATTMFVVRLPSGRYPATDDGSNGLTHALRRGAASQGAVEVPCYAEAGHLWARVSCAMYNDRWEYERLAEAVLELQGR